MNRAFSPVILALICGIAGIAGIGRAGKPERPPVRAAVIERMTGSGMWQELSKQFEKETGWPIETVVTGSKAELAEFFRKGGADILTMHAGDDAAGLAADGFGINVRPWACNEHCIMGPATDPAGIRGMRDGAAAMKKIAETKSPFVAFTGPGSREVMRKLWDAAGVKPEGNWLLQDRSESGQDAAQFAASKNAYVIVGRVPLPDGKTPPGKLEVLVQGDAAMRRPYIVMEASREKFSKTNSAGAKALVDWLTGERAREFLKTFATKSAAGQALFFPVDGNVDK